MKQLQVREREVNRLAKAVEAGSDPDKLHLENTIETGNKTIQQLKLQLESLHLDTMKFSVCLHFAADGIFAYWYIKGLDTDVQRQISDMAAENEQLSKKLDETTFNNKTLVSELKSLSQITEGLKEKQSQPPNSR